MAEFIKDCIHGLKDLDIKNIDIAYIKELEIKIKADFTSVKRGEKSIIEFRDMIAAEKMYVRGFLYRMDTAIREDVKEWNKIQEWPTYEHIPEKDIVEQSIVFGTIRHLHFEKTGIETKGLSITLEEAQKKHALAFYVPIFAEYLEFLRRMHNDIITVINNPEYWKARETPLDTQTGGELPPVIQAALKEGLLDTLPVNGKHHKKGDKKDSKIIEWIFDYSGYGDSLTTELYMQYIHTSCKPTTIQDYITRKKRSPD